METVVRDASFSLAVEFIRPDTKGRISLGGVLSETKQAYQVFVNSLGQIVLDPVKTVPTYEAWLHANPAALDRVRQGLKESGEGKRVDLGSFTDAVQD